MQEKTNMVADNSARLGHTINRGKSKVCKTNTSNNTPITASPISAAFWETREEQMQMSEPASVKHKQPSIS
ncbi:hypothetical protein DPMN_131863 [Dreissena polymorpha]|uniref:Uncharacterized protein n=1 Tax=Dreissena polymorpha TaxID=45954 RepID=A0A9D4JCM2_DREPO|nr:hypothetical protein DPMN_131863 [Dreissena polymorpha]